MRKFTSGKRQVSSLAVLCLAILLFAQGGNSTEAVSVTNAGVTGDKQSSEGSITPDGRYVLFWSEADDLVPNDNNARADVFLRDILAGTTEVISVSSAEVQGDDNSGMACVSQDGRYVAFQSFAGNLVNGGPGTQGGVYVRDRQAGTTELVSLSSAGVVGNGSSNPHGISADGRFVVFQSSGDNLVPNDTNGAMDIFVRDRQNSTTERASLSSSEAQTSGTNPGSEGPGISADGRLVVFTSSAKNLVPNDTNNCSDIFIRDRQTGLTERISVTTQGAERVGSSYDPSMSSDGRFVCFFSRAPLVDDDTNLVGDIYVRDRVAGTTVRVSLTDLDQQCAGTNSQNAISDDGRFVAFVTGASNMTNNDLNGAVPDVFVRDRLLNTTVKVSVGNPGNHGILPCYLSWICQSLSGDGRACVFTTNNETFVPLDNNQASDVFVRHRNITSVNRLTVISYNVPNGAAAIKATVDHNGQGDGTTPYDRAYDPGTQVTLSAGLGSVGTKLFDRFELDGVKLTGPVTMDGNHVVKAFYVQGYNLTVQSQNPATGVPVHLSSPDFFKRGDANTSFNRTYKTMTPVSVTAPATFGGHTFLHWDKGGTSQQEGKRTVTVIMSANTTMKAVYTP